jgi:hypothetical protein
MKKNRIILAKSVGKVNILKKIRKLDLSRKDGMCEYITLGTMHLRSIYTGAKLQNLLIPANVEHKLFDF